MKDLAQLHQGIYRMTANLDDEDLPLYEGCPIVHGLSLHSYFIKGEKGALIDPYCEGGYGYDEVEEDLKAFQYTWADVDYVLFTWTSTQQSELIRQLKAKQPHIQWIDTGLTQSVPLGAGKVLEVAAAAIWETSSQIFFSGKGFSGFGSVEEAVFYDELNSFEKQFFDDEALRYFVNVYQTAVSCPATAQMIAPAHGILWRSPVQGAAQRQQQFITWATEAASDAIALIWPAGIDHDAVVEALVAGVQAAGVDMAIFRPPQDHRSFIAAQARKSAALIVSPALDTSVFSGLKKETWTVVESDLVALKEAAWSFALSIEA